MSGLPCLILLVEDDPDLRESVREVLVEHGCQVECAEDGASAFAWLARSPRPSLVLLDFLMPRMNGWEFLDQLQAHPALRDLPVVAMSASRVKHPAVAATLPKPFDISALVTTVQQVVGSR
jgi:CheY-like chemotaxis protein